MKKLKTKSELRAFIKQINKEGKSIGFVPTMGNLHAGHITLIDESIKENDVTIVSIFINPTQFNKIEDFEKYPRTLEDDFSQLLKAGATAVFCPDEKEIYGEGSQTAIMMGGGFMNTLEGYSRPGHFAGVSLIVSKLFNLVQPDRVYFGQKDAQQSRIIYQLIEDLSYPIEMKVLPIVRESDGLAMSSRNKRLSKQGRAIAPSMYEGLKEGAEAIKKGERDSMQVVAVIAEHLVCFSEIEIDYIMIVDPLTFEEVIHIQKDVLIVATIELEGVRLIDNYYVSI